MLNRRNLSTWQVACHRFMMRYSNRTINREEATRAGVARTICRLCDTEEPINRERLAMNYRTATLDQLRKERLRLINMQRMLQQRRDASANQRAGRNAGFRPSASAHQQDRELMRVSSQLNRLDAELAYREQRAGTAEATAPPDSDAKAAASPDESRSD